MKTFNTKNVTEQDLLLIGLLGRVITLENCDGDMLNVGRLTTQNTPNGVMKYFNVTSESKQYVFGYYEIKEVCPGGPIILTW